MTVFFTTSWRGFKEHTAQLNQVYETIKSFKSIDVIAPGWNDNYQPLVEAARARVATNSRLADYHAIRKGIRMADAVIFEVTRESFQIGHETSFALAEKKPVLCLSRDEDFSTRIQHDYFFGAQYTEKTLKGLVQDFLARARELSLSKRFNLFLYPHQLQFIEEQGSKMGMNRSEYIRYLINQDKQRSSGY